MKIVKQKVYDVTELSFQILKSNPPKLAILAGGNTRTGGWSDAELRPLFVPGVTPKGGVYEFEFVATPPQGIAVQMITPIAAVYIFEEMPKTVTVVVYAETNKMKMPVDPKAAKEVAGLDAVKAIRKGKGYSEAFDFKEAFIKAVQNLPLDPAPYPDKLYNVRVTQVGGEFGGFVGFRRMYVEVESN